MKRSKRIGKGKRARFKKRRRKRKHERTTEARLRRALEVLGGIGAPKIDHGRGLAEAAIGRELADAEWTTMRGVAQLETHYATAENLTPRDGSV